MIDTSARYLDLLRDTLLNRHYLDHEPATRSKDDGTPEVRRQRRAEGRDWPAWAPTMVGGKRLDHLRLCIQRVCAQDVPGDVVETGVWRGGACIYARACLDVYDPTRRVYVCDSFKGLPPPAPTWPQDKGSRRHERVNFRVGRAEVMGNFSRFGVPAQNVTVLEGWFEDTIPGPISTVAVLRLDGDMYGSTMHVLRALYPKVPTGGFVIVDDWKASGACKRAVQDFWKEQGIAPKTSMVDWTCLTWRKA